MGKGSSDESGPVPVRDLVQPRPAAPADAAPEAGETDEAGEADRPGGGREAASSDPGVQAREHRFEHESEVWVARRAGEGSYGTGPRGAARLVAVHFFRESEPDRPVREALLAAGAFDGLRPEELRTMLEAATPIELDR